MFLLNKRQNLSDTQERVPLDSPLAKPMQMAPSGKSGVLVGLDYRGVNVLAAYEPVKGIGLGIVAKIDLAKIREPL